MTIMLDGRCHCGAMTVGLSTGLVPGETAPRACDCSFCRKHGVSWLSDPAGQLSITENERGALLDYRQGSGQARFVLCARCGVVLAVTMEHQGHAFGAVNVGCLRACDDFAPPTTVSPQKLAPDEKAARWMLAWTADVRIRRADTEALR